MTYVILWICHNAKGVETIPPGHKDMSAGSDVIS